MTWSDPFVRAWANPRGVRGWGEQFSEAWSNPEHPDHEWLHWVSASGSTILLALLYEAYGVHPTQLPWPG